MTFSFDYQNPRAFFEANPLSRVDEAATDPFTSPVTHKEWTDQLFLTNYRGKVSLLRATRDLPTSIVATKFLIDVYCGVKPKDLTPTVLLSNWLAAIMQVTIGEDCYGYPTGSAAPRATSVQTNILPACSFISDSGLAREKVKYGEGLEEREVSSEILLEWRGKVLEALGVEVTQIEVIREVCFVVDTTFRCAQKEPSKVSEHIAVKSSRAYRGVTGTEPLCLFPPPHASFISYVRENFTTASEQGLNRLRISMYSVLLGKNNQLIKGWLAATHMLALGGTGLGLIDWFFKVVTEASKPPSYCLGFFNYGNMMEGVARLVHRGQISKDQITWRWFRLVDDAYLSSYFTAFDKPMTCVCAYELLETDMGGQYYGAAAERIINRKRDLEGLRQAVESRRDSNQSDTENSDDEEGRRAGTGPLVF
ncbi:hypothetical protein J6590_082073 [Homalodisca vitripennis]|nr:hypothetical protein J6590_081550 [Homalodisca vitripennis]KAG8285345.1 hypothetical protein J6590_082073 [Homalodisca vitripennis]